MKKNLRVGQRVRVQGGQYLGNEGYVRFVGVTSFRNGEWIGLELDRPVGKNDGTVAGVYYFPSKDKHGIFLKGGSEIQVLPELEPKQAPKTPMGPPKHPATGSRSATIGGIASSSRQSISSVKRPLIAPSIASSTSVSTTGKRMSTSASMPARKPARNPRLSIADRSTSPRKPTITSPISSTPIAKRFPVVSSMKSASRSPPMSTAASESPSIETVLSPNSIRSDQRSALVSNQSAKSVLMSSATSTFTTQQKKLVEDLRIKVSFLEKKRLEDAEKVKGLSELRDKNVNFQNIIQKLNAKCQTYHEENAAMKKDVKSKMAQLEEVQLIAGENQSILEMAILDREIAEEKSESLETEVENVKERLEELELENEILRDEKAELEKDMSPEERASQGWMQLISENERLRKSLIVLKEWSKDREEKYRAEIRQLEQDINELSDVKAKLDNTKALLLITQAEGDDLKDQLDAVSGAETIMEQLQTENEVLSHQISQLKDDVLQLENLHELNEELEANRVANAKDMQDEMDSKDSEIKDLCQQLALQQEGLAEREDTILRFRNLVLEMQTDLEDMRASKEITETEAQHLENSTRAIMHLNRQLKASASSTTVKALDVELRQMEADQAGLQLSIISLFVPEAFNTEKDSISTLLRFKRIAFKAKLIHNFIKQRLAGSATTLSTANSTSACEALSKLVWTNAMSNRFVASMETSSVDQFARYDTTYHELESTERALNGYIENLKRDELQEQQVAEGLARSTAVITHLAEIYLESNLATFAESVLMKTQVFQSELENAATILAALQSDVIATAEQQEEEEEEEEDSEDYILFKKHSDLTLAVLRTAKVVAGKLHTLLRDMSSRSLTLDQDVDIDFGNCEEASNAVFEYFKALAHSAIKVFSEDITISVTFVHIISTLRQASSDHLMSDSNDLFFKPQKLIITLTNWMNDLHHQASEFSNLIEFEKPPPPWILRSRQLQSQKTLSADAEADLKVLKRDLHDRATKLRLGQNQLEEAQIKIELLEQRYKEAQKKAELITRLSESLRQTQLRESGLTQMLKEHELAAKVLEEERDRYMRATVELKPIQQQHQHQNKSGISMSNEAGAFENYSPSMSMSMASAQALKSEVASLQAANRTLRRQFTHFESQFDSDPLGWLSIPLLIHSSLGSSTASAISSRSSSISLSHSSAPSASDDDDTYTRHNNDQDYTQNLQQGLKQKHDCIAANIRMAINSVAALPLQVRPIEFLSADDTQNEEASLNCRDGGSARQKDTPLRQLDRVKRAERKVRAGIGEMVRDLKIQGVVRSARFLRGGGGEKRRRRRGKKKRKEGEEESGYILNSPR